MYSLQCFDKKKDSLPCAANKTIGDIFYVFTTFLKDGREIVAIARNDSTGRWQRKLWRRKHTLDW